MAQLIEVCRSSDCHYRCQKLCDTSKAPGCHHDPNTPLRPLPMLQMTADILLSGWKSPVRTDTRRKHHSLRHYHRTPRDSRTILRTPARAVTAPRIARPLFLHRHLIHITVIDCPRSRVRRSSTEYHLCCAADRGQGTPHCKGVASRQIRQGSCAREYGGRGCGRARGEEVEGRDAQGRTCGGISY